LKKSEKEEPSKDKLKKRHASPQAIGRSRNLER